MGKLGDGIKYDLSFIKSHTLQPKWYKVFKVFILASVLVAYYVLFGLSKTIVFFAVFLAFALAVHMLYRVKTRKFTRTWLDFVVDGDGEKAKPVSIGWFYYCAVALSAIIAVLVSQTLG